MALTRAVKPGTKRKIQGMIAKSFAADVEKLHGAKSAANSPSAKTKLVEAKLDVVRAGWLLQHVGIVGRLCCFDRVDRVQRDEIHRRLQRRFDPGPGAPFCNRGSRIADQRGISSLWKYERERRIRGSEPVDSHFRPNGKGTIYVAANKSLGRWNYSGLIVEITKTHQRIDLLRSPVPAGSP